MGGWDLKCAICGAPFGPFGPFGAFEDNGIAGYGYDREVLEAEDLEWLRKVRLIGYNPDAFGVKKCFITDPGEEQEYGYVGCGAGTDPNAPRLGNSEVVTLAAFSYYDPNVPLAVPFHEDCFHVLSKTIYHSLHGKVPADLSKGEDFAGENDEALGFVSKRTLYMALRRMYDAESCQPFLDDVDYGEVSDRVREQYWECHRGDEAWVSNPYTSPQLKNFLTEGVRHLGTFAPIPTNVPTYDTSLSNPFARLPKEIISEILLYLPFSTLKSIALLGLLPFNLSQHNAFWHLKTELDLPFLYDLPILGGERNWLLIYLELHRQCFATTPPKTSPPNKGGYGEIVGERDTSLVLGLANRRRVWSICEHITRVYLEVSKALEEEEQKQEDVDNEIIEKSLSLYVPIVGNPPGSGTAISCYFITGWWGLKQRLELGFCFEGASGGFLKGIDVNKVGSFGMRTGNNRKVVIEKGKWIEGFVLNVKGWTDDVLGGTKMGIMGVEILLDDESVIKIGDEIDLSGHKRLLRVNPGMVITGLVGEVDDGIIKRLGLLQAPNPSSPPSSNLLSYLSTTAPKKDVPQIQKVLWYSSLPPSNIHAIPYKTGYWMPDRSYDTIPMSYILFSPDGTYQNLTKLKSIESDPHMRCWAVEYNNEPAKQTGPMDKMDEIKCFDLDGERWERVIKVEIGMNSLVEGVKITTNRNRIALFGHSQKNYHVEYQETDSAFIAGLYISWGYGGDRRIVSTVSILSAAKPGHAYEEGKIEGTSIREVWNPVRKHPSRVEDEEWIAFVHGDEGYEGRFW